MCGSPLSTYRSYTTNREITGCKQRAVNAARWRVRLERRHGIAMLAAISSPPSNAASSPLSRGANVNVSDSEATTGNFFSPPTHARSGRLDNSPNPRLGARR